MSQGPLLAVAALVLPATRLGLRLMPFAAVVGALEALGRRWPARGRRRVPSKKIANAVSAASQRLPGSWTCLEQALVARFMLRAAGYDARLVAGVRHDVEEGLRAHAWVECDQQVLIGGTVEKFEPFHVDLGKPRT